MSSLPKAATIRVTDDKGPVPFLILQCRYITTRKNDYFVLCDPLDAQGEFILTNDFAMKSAQEDYEMGIMDYVPLKEGFAGLIQVRLLDVPSLLERATSDRFPPESVAAFLKAAEVLKFLDVKKLAIRVFHQEIENGARFVGANLRFIDTDANREELL